MRRSLGLLITLALATGALAYTVGAASGQLGHRTSTAERTTPDASPVAAQAPAQKIAPQRKALRKRMQHEGF